MSWETWRSRNVFSYGRQDKGQARPEVLAVVARQTSHCQGKLTQFEYGLTDIQEYYANTGVGLEAGS